MEYAIRLAFEVGRVCKIGYIQISRNHLPVRDCVGACVRASVHASVLCRYVCMCACARVRVCVRACVQCNAS